MTSTTTQMASFYDEQRAAADLDEYRQKGAIPSTRALIEALKAKGSRARRYSTEAAE